MKNTILLLAALFLFSCSKEETPTQTFDVIVKIESPENCNGRFFLNDHVVEFNKSVQLVLKEPIETRVIYYRCDVIAPPSSQLTIVSIEAPGGGTETSFESNKQNETRFIAIK